MFLAKKLNKGAGTPAVLDAQFNYVTMLLHGDGTNGAQNNTFLDSSSNNFTITRNGNTTQGSFSPYGSNWSNYFNGSSSYLSTASNAAYQFGTGDFTIECWINMAAGTSLTAYWRSFVSVCGDAVFTNAVTLFIGDGASGSSVAGEVIVVIGSNNLRIYGGEDIRNLGWVHVAVTRSGTTLRLFVNGTQKSSGTNSSNINETSYGAQIGVSRVAEANYFIGYVSNVRIVKGTAVYTSAFTPSTTPLTAITNTSLLTCQSNRFVDNSASPLTITVNGTPSVERFNPFGASTAYSTSVIGGSGYFDGSGDYLTAGSNSAFAVGTGDFTFQAWVYPKAYTSPVSAIFDTGSGVVGGRFSVVLYSSGIVKIDNNTNLLSSSSALPLNQWTFISVIRSSGTMTMYFNSTSVASGSIANNFTETQSVIGKTVDNYYFQGYITDLRLVKGTALSNTVPTAPLTNITNTSLLTTFQNGAIYDNAMMNDLETVGNAQISTSVVKYGTGSLYFDGSGDYLLGASTPNMSFGAGNFTVEMWVYRQVTGGTNQGLYQKGYGGGTNLEFALSIDTSNRPVVYITTDGSSLISILTSSTTISQNTWTHLAVTRSGSTWRVFIGGTLGVSATDSSTLYTGNGQISVGANPVGVNPFTGYIDDLRITKGYARYTANFTPPTAAFPNTGPI